MDERMRMTLRDRIIGVLLRQARQRDGRTREECAEALGVSTDTIDAYEQGRMSISLPELEVLGYMLGTPVVHLTDRESEVKTRPHDLEFKSVLDLRHRIIGALFRRARLEADLTRGDLARLLDCSTSRITEYEEGERPIPFAELEFLTGHLDLPADYFQDGHDSTVGKWHRQEETDRQFHKIPSHIQEFVAKPINIKYMELAIKLSEMPASKLRAIAEGLLEITY